MDTGQKGSLNAEQIAQMQSHTSAGVPVVAPVIPDAPVAQPNVAPAKPILRKPKGPQQPPIVKKKQQEQRAAAKKTEPEVVVETAKASDKISPAPVVQLPLPENGETYFYFETDEEEVMEMDLITYREKGAETRYLALSIFGTEVSTDPAKQLTIQHTSLTIRSKEEFEKLKAFISQLNWND